MIDKSLESDWKTFKKQVPQWRERYLNRKNREIVAILKDNERTPTDQFWDTKEMIAGEAKVLMDCLDGHSRSKMVMFLLLMLRHGIIEELDLSPFSEEVKGHILLLRDEFGNRDSGT